MNRIMQIAAQIALMQMDNADVEIFWMDTEGGEPGDGAWFWRDDECEEAMGPFESRDEAEADYRAIRLKK